MGVQGTFELRLSGSHNELTQDAYCRTLLAQNFVPAYFPAGELEYRIDPEGFSTSGFWHEPLTGVLMLQPNFLSEQFWNTTTYEANKWIHSDWTYGSGDFGTLYLQNIASTPCSPVVWTLHTNTAGNIDPLTGLTSLIVHGSTGTPPNVLLSGNSNADYAYLLKSSRKLARNEGFALQILTHDIKAGDIFPYLLIYFGGNYCLLFGSGGRCELWKNKPADDTDPAADTWERIQTMDYSSSVDPQAGNVVSLMVVPFSERFIGFYIGPGMVNSNWAGQNGGQDTSPSRRYLVEVAPKREYDIGTGTDDDDDDGLYKITPEDYVTIAAPKLAQFALGFYELRYPSSSKTIHLTPENLGKIHLTQPSWESNGAINRGLVTFDTVNIDDTAWDETTDTEYVAEIVATAGQGLDNESSAGEYCYSPEVHWATATIDPEVEEIEHGDEIDLDELYQVLTITQRINEPAWCDFTTVADESIYDYKDRHSESVKFSITDVGLVDYTLFEGRVTAPSIVLQPQIPFMQFQASDGWQALEDTTLWDSPVYDGRNIYLGFQWALNSAGYDDSQIYLPADVYDIILPEAPRPQDYVFRAQAGDTAADFCRRLLDAGLDVRLTYKYATAEWIALDGVTELDETMMVWVIELRPVFINETDTPVVAKFWGSRPLGETWAAESARFVFLAGTPNSMKAWTIEKEIHPPRWNSLHLDAPTGSGKDAKRNSIQTVLNQDSIDDNTSRDYVGRIKRGYIPAATHGARTPEDLTLIARTIEREEMHAVEYVTIRGEWRPWVRPDAFVEVYARNPITDFVEKWGVYRVLEAVPSFTYDNDAAQLALIEATYSLQWEAAGAEYTDPNEEE
jgi:hypothetical protein